MKQYFCFDLGRLLMKPRDYAGTEKTQEHQGGGRVAMRNAAASGERLATIQFIQWEEHALLLSSFKTTPRQSKDPMLPNHVRLS